MSLDSLLARLDRVRTTEALVAAEREGLRRLYAARLAELLPVGSGLDLRPERLLGLPRGLRALLFGMQVSPSVQAAVFTTIEPAVCTVAPDASTFLWSVRAIARVPAKGGGRREVVVRLAGLGLDVPAVQFLGGRGRPYIETLSRWLEGEG